MINQIVQIVIGVETASVRTNLQADLVLLFLCSGRILIVTSPSLTIGSCLNVRRTHILLMENSASKLMLTERAQHADSALDSMEHPRAKPEHDKHKYD